MYEFFLYGKETAEKLIIRPVEESDLFNGDNSVTANGMLQ